MHAMDFQVDNLRVRPIFENDLRNKMLDKVA